MGKAADYAAEVKEWCDSMELKYGAWRLCGGQVVVRLCRKLILNTKTKSTVEARDDSIS
jgi:hypothetical protein